MFFDLLKSLLLLSSLSLGVDARSSPNRLSERAGACSSYTIISTRGTGELQGPSSGFRKMISTTLAAVPGGKEYDTIYPAGFSQVSTAGTADIVKKVQSANTQCYVLTGYSQGATATVEALKKLSGKAADSVKAAVLIGNPERKPGLACNVDSKGGSATKNASGVQSFQGGIPASWVSKVLDICASGDGICDTKSGFGITAAHLSYGGDSNVQSMGAKFMQKGLSAGGRSASSVGQKGSGETEDEGSKESSDAGDAFTKGTSKTDWFSKFFPH